MRLVGYRGLLPPKTLEWDRNDFCRGWLLTGATGSGKTKMIDLLFHGLFTSERGVERKDWQQSQLRANYEAMLATHNKDTLDALQRVRKIQAQKSSIEQEIQRLREASLSDHLASMAAPETQEAIAELTKRCARLKKELQQVEVAKSRFSSAGAAYDDDFDRNKQDLQAKLEEAESKLSEIQAKAEPEAIQAKMAEIRSLNESEAALHTAIAKKRLATQRQMLEVEEHRYAQRPWGGICIDEKGSYWSILTELASHYDRDHHLMLLQTKPQWAPPGWKPPARYNLLSNPKITESAYARAIVSTAKAVDTSSGSGGSDKAFFPNQAQINIGKGIELARAIGAIQARMGSQSPLRPSLSDLLNMLTSQNGYNEYLQRHLPTLSADFNQWIQANKIPVSAGKAASPPPFAPIPDLPGIPSDEANKLNETLKHFAANYWSQPKDQLGGVTSTVYNYLAYFANPDVKEVFCADNTFDFHMIDKGVIVCLAMPQSLATERRYVCALLKLLFYNHALQRFDGQPGWKAKCNLLVCWQDEAQRFIQEDDGNVDVLREAQATTVISTQSKTSLRTVLGEKTEPTIVNLRNRVIFQSADFKDAEESANFIGKSRVKKTSRTYSSQGVSRNVQDDWQYKVDPNDLLDIKRIRKFDAYVVHAAGRLERLHFPPLEPNGTLAPWYRTLLWRDKQPLKWLATRIAMLIKKPAAEPAH